MEPSWLPLESNPDVMNKYLGKVGVSDKWKIIDVLGLDPDALAVIPQPVQAFILLFPCSNTYEKLKDEQAAEVKEKGQDITKDLFYMKQYVGNACGAIALIHSVANSHDLFPLKDGCLKSFLDEAKNLSPEERGHLLDKSIPFSAVHNEIAVEGQTQAPTADNAVDHHFAAFIHKDGCLYELDGRKEFPINHGPTSPKTFVQDAGKVMQDILAKDPKELRFGICALTVAED